MKTPPIVSPRSGTPRASSSSSRRRSWPAPATRWRLNADGCPGWPVDKEYWFEGPDGRVSLAGLFEGRRQLIVYRAFYGPEVTTYAEGGSYPERACVGCSFVADQVAHPGHLHARNTTLAFASRAPQAEIQRPEGAPRVGAHPLVHDHRRLRQGLRRRRVARHQRLHPRGRPDLPHLLHQQPRRRADGQHLELPRHHRARPPGGRGRTRLRATRKLRRTSGGTTTTYTTPAVVSAPGRRDSASRDHVSRDRVSRDRVSRRGTAAATTTAWPVARYGRPT